MSDYLHSCLLWVAVGCATVSVALLTLVIIVYVSS